MCFDFLSSHNRMNYEKAAGFLELLLINQFHITPQLLTSWPKADYPQGVWQGAREAIGRSVYPLLTPPFPAGQTQKHRHAAPAQGSEKGA